MSPFETLILVIGAYFLGKRSGRCRAQVTSYPIQQPTVSMPPLDTPQMRHILTGQLAPWQIEMMKRDSPATS
jgi:hypothetical protein